MPEPRPYLQVSERGIQRKLPRSLSGKKPERPKKRLKSRLRRRQRKFKGARLNAASRTLTVI